MKKEKKKSERERDKFYIFEKVKKLQKIRKTKKNLRVRVHDTLLYKILREYHTTTKKIKTQLIFY